MRDWCKPFILTDHAQAKILAFVIIFFWFFSSGCNGQSIEAMPGTKRIFIDAQWLKAFDAEYKWTLFSRSRATAEYNENVNNLFTGAYLNYTSKSGFGGTVLGTIATFGSGIDAGVHFFKNTESFMVYALPTIAVKADLNYSWFSIMRFTPAINDHLKLYTSLEIFSNFDKFGHVAGVQRMRIGLAINGIQFGIAFNFSAAGEGYRITDTNPGLFIRKVFD